LKAIRQFRDKLPWQYTKSDSFDVDRLSHDWDALFLSITMGMATTVGMTYLLYALGFTITAFYGILYVALVLLYLYLASLKHRGRWKKLFVVQVLVHVAAILFVVPFYDLGGDGMASHQDSVLAMECEWNPILDPYFLESKELAAKYPEAEHFFWAGGGALRSFGYALSAIIAKSTGSHEAGKAITLIGFWMSFCGAMAFSARIFRKRYNRWLFAIASALNPVICYQFLSYWQDGFLAGVYTALLFAGMIWVLRPDKWRFLIPFVSLSFVLSGLKLAGVGYAGLTAFFVYLVIFLRGGMRFYTLFVVGALNVFLIGLAGVLMGAWTFQSKVVDPLAEKIAHFDSSEVNAGGVSYTQVLEYKDMNRFLVFLASMSSVTKPVARSIELKLPFSTNWQELRTFFYFFEDPRAGGFGVFYSGLLLLSVFLFLVAMRSDWRTNVLCGTVVFIILVPLLFVPTYWARWIPHAWLIPLFLTLPFWLGQEADNSVSGKVFSLRHLMNFSWERLFVAFAIVNSVLIVVLYVVGNAFGSRVLMEQLEIVHSLPEPVLYGNGNYPTNRKWLIDEGIDFEMTWDPEHWKKGYIQFYRTDTRIFLTEEDLKRSTSNGETVEDSLNALKSEVSAWQKNQWLSEIWVPAS